MRSLLDTLPCHIVLAAQPGLTPFDAGGAELAVEALRDVAAEAGAMVLAFAVLPAAVEVLLAGADHAAPRELSDRLQSLLTRRVNRLLKRSGPLLAETAAITTLGADVAWQALADAIEQRVVAEEAAPNAAAGFCSANPDYEEWVRQPPAARSRRPARRREPVGDIRCVGDVVSVADVPTVVQLGRVRDLPEAERRDMVERWFLTDGRTRRVARALLAGLAGSGGGWFVSGLYGSGKSHLLAVLAQVAESAPMRQALLDSHPELAGLAPALGALRERLVVPLPLDEQGPAEDLEELVFEAAAEAFRLRTGRHVPLAEAPHVVAVAREHLLDRYRHELDGLAGGDWEALSETSPERAAEAAERLVRERGLPLRFVQSRVERLGRLVDVVTEAGLGGVVLLLDELQVFLSSRERQGLHRDAGFLQFLGQRAETSPLWVVAALQRQIEDVGDIEHYTLRQIKDRYETRLVLPLAAAREVLSRTVLPRRDPATLEAAVEAAVRAWTGGERQADLSAAKLRDVYPLHPLTFACLEASAERFLARTRSIIEFAQARVRGDELAEGVLSRPATALITPDELWDHFARDLTHHVELHRYREVVAAWYERHLPSLLEEPDPLAMRLIKLLLVLRLSGLERGVRDLAAALEPAHAGRAGRVGELLELFRTRGSYVTVERRPGRLQDVYSVDLDFDVNEVLRRRARALEATLTVGDGRLTAVGVGACRDESFPLAAALHPHSAEVVWRNTPRSIFVAMRDLTSVSSHELENLAALLAGPDLAECAYLFLAEPQRAGRQEEAFAAALRPVRDDRWKQALAAWVPREETAEERSEWVSLAALELLRQDPTLAADERGRALRERLDEHADARAAALSELLGRRYAEGVVLSAAGRTEVPPGGWRRTAAAIVGARLERVFPRFVGVEPRRRLVTAGVSDDLLIGLIVPGEAVVSPASVLAAAIEDLAVPLGVAAGGRGEYRLKVECAELAGAVLSMLPARAVPLAAVEAHLAKSEWGLVDEQARVLVGALLRCGYLVGRDDSGRPVRAAAPLRAVVSAVEPAPVMAPEGWQALAELSEAALGGPLPPLDAAAQQEFYERLLRWREAVAVDLRAVRGAMEACAGALGHERIAWRESAAVGEGVEGLAAAVEPGRLAPDGLLPVAEHRARRAEGWVGETLGRFGRLREFATGRGRALVAAYEYLTSAALPARHPLGEGRESLLGRLAAGDAVAFGAAELLADAAAWQRSYAAAYGDWHAEVHHAARFEPYDRFRTSPPMRVLLNLSRLDLDAGVAAAAVAEELRRERGKQCRRSDLRQALAEAPVCPDCRLVLGELVPLRPVAELEAVARAGVGELLRALRRSEARDKVGRGTADLAPDDPRLAHLRTLLEVAEPDIEELLPATSFAVIDLLNLCLTARVAGRRSLARLHGRLTGKRLPARQVRGIFDQWLDPLGDLGEDDLLEMDE
ncbi:MAG: hypothetical protein HYU66_02285 [Armatimonadetes bacterium]|nr:hypothetical protein [Armatimonadota bacterium]